MDSSQLREYIVRPALEVIGYHSLAAENLIMGTGAHESVGFKYVKQLGTGPAVGLFQMEPNTYIDIWENYLAYRGDLPDVIRGAIDYSSDDMEHPNAPRMIWDIRYATIMCRIHYLRVPEALPNAMDVWALAAYWKKYYNTILGAGTEQEFVDNYRMTQ